MKINKIAGTCSMFELANLNSYSLEGLDRQGFLRITNRMIHEIDREKDQNSKYALIYNCNDYMLHRDLRNIGFRYVTKYRGEHGKMVSIFLMEPNRTWLQRILRK